MVCTGIHLFAQYFLCFTILCQELLYEEFTMACTYN